MGYLLQLSHSRISIYGFAELVSHTHIPGLELCHMSTLGGIEVILKFTTMCHGIGPPKVDRYIYSLIINSSLRIKA